MIDRRSFLKIAGTGACALGLQTELFAGGSGDKNDTLPNIVLCMTDDQGWGDTGYNGHPLLKTPHLDDMSQSGIRFDNFYAAAPVCSPTRGSVLTGRHPDRYGIFSHGQKLKRDEVTIAQVLKKAGYVCGHFGKWHLNGIAGKGLPIEMEDEHGPRHFGFDHWFSVSNYFDLHTTFSRNGELVKTEGDGSDAIVEEATRFMAATKKKKKPFLAVIWYGSPHVPLKAMPEDKAPYGKSGDYLGELAAVDRSIGTLRKRLRTMKVADNTVLWFCSDNGPKQGGNDSTKGLRGKKLQLFEGGIRVPGLLEWPAKIKKPFNTSIPCSTSDMFPTLLHIAKTRSTHPKRPLDGINIMPLLEKKWKRRPEPICFKHRGHAAVIDNNYKYHLKKGKEDLYDLSNDLGESKDISSSQGRLIASMRKTLADWQASVDKSFAGADYSSK